MQNFGPSAPLAERDDVSRLLARARALIGVTLGALADEMGVPVPTVHARAKGWPGQLIERELGADDGGHGVDFARLGVELKTVPVDPRGVPIESTWVCHVDPAIVGAESWRTSYARGKLGRVLFVTLELRSRQAPIEDRRVRAVVLWSPRPDEDAALEADFELFSREFFRRGRAADLRGHHGQVMQVRPKGRNAADTRATFGPAGEAVRVGRMGFYLRPAFVGQILKRG